MIRFKYYMKPGLQQLVNQTIANYTDNFLYGMMEAGLRSDALKHCAMFLVCPEDYNNGQQFNHDPVAVVAKNSGEAATLFYDEFDKIGYVVAEIENKCNDIIVEAL